MLTEFDIAQRKWYDAEARNYEKNRYTSVEGQCYSSLENELLWEIVQPKANMKILDMAAGTGRISISLLESGAAVFGVDISEGVLRYAQGKVRGASKRNICFPMASGRFLPFRDKSFDAVTSFKFFHLVPKDQKGLFLDEMLRVLKPEGRLVVEFNSPFYGFVFAVYRYWRAGNIEHIRSKCLFPDQVKTLFKGLEIRDLIGVKLPLSGHLSRVFGYDLILRFNKMLCRVPLIRYLCYAIIINVRKDSSS